MIFSARVCNFITANRYLRIGETLIPRRRFPFRNPAFVLYVREFQMQQELPFSIGFHTLFFLFTGYALPVLCISSVCLSRLLFSCPQVRNHSVLKGCMAPCLQLSLTLPSIDKAARWITAYLSGIILFSAELPFMDCTPALIRLIHPHHASVFKLTAHETKLRLLR